jgi:hypothetical protein
MWPPAYLSAPILTTCKQPDGVSARLEFAKIEAIVVSNDTFFAAAVGVPMVTVPVLRPITAHGTRALNDASRFAFDLRE